MRRLVCCAVALAVLAVPGSAWAHNLIQGGTLVTAPGAWPWMVWIVGVGSAGEGIDGCSGELITPTTVLTAAHCLDPAAGVANYDVSSARENPGWVEPPPYPPSSPYETVPASAGVPDPDFDFQALHHGTIPDYDDVGVISLPAPLPGASWLPLVQPDQLTPFATENGFSGLAAGYGLTSPTGTVAGNLYQTVISSAFIDTVTGDDNDTTGALFDYSNPTTTGTCEGDSGGPLLVPIDGGAPPVTTNASPSNGQWAVVGIVHAGPDNECNDGTYTNVAYDVSGSNDVAAWLAPYETPFDYTAPSVSGAPVVGNQLTCQPGTWAEPTASFTYTWETVGDATPIADGQTYTPQSSDVGSQLECAVQATVTGFGSTNSATSGPVAVTTVGINTSQLPASVTVGGSVADQATMVGGDNPTGTVTFDLYNNSNGTGTPLFTDTETLSGGTATSAGYTTTAAGTDYWVVTYNGDANNHSVSSYAAEPVTISPASPSINTTQQPASVTLGGSIADQATMVGGDSPTGTVTFNLYYYTSLGSRKLLFSDPNEPLVNGVATSAGLTTTPNDVGTDYWVATYNGDANNSSVSSGATAEPVIVSLSAATSTSVACVPSSVVVAQSTSCTATVTNTSSSSTPTGQVVGTINGVSTGISGSACTLSGSGTTASCSFTYTGTVGQAGNDTIEAAYQGNSSFDASSNTTGVHVAFRGTSTQVSCSPNPVTSGLSTTCTATVTDTAAGTQSPPTGTVAFSSKKADRFNPTSCTLSAISGNASSCQTTDTPPSTVGKHVILARYNPTGADKPGTANTTITVTRP